MTGFLAKADRQGSGEEALCVISTAFGRPPDSTYGNMSRLSVFHVQGDRPGGSDTETFEFAPKTFPDDLVAAQVFEATVRQAAETTEAPVATGDARIDRWAQVTCDGKESIEICP